MTNRQSIFADSTSKELKRDKGFEFPDEFVTEPSEKLKNELKKSMKQEVVQKAASDAVFLTERLFNDTEKRMSDKFDGWEQGLKMTVITMIADTFKQSELAWLQYTIADQYAKYLSFSAISANVAAQMIAE